MPDFLRAIDEPILRALYAGNAPQYVVTAALVLAFIGSEWALLFIALPLAVRRLRLRLAALILSLMGTLVATTTLVSVIKVLVGRVRPCNALAWAHTLPIAVPTDPSFPSGHAAGSFSFAFFFLSAYRPLGFVGLAIAPVIAASRVVLGVHYPTDVFTGALIGAAMGTIGGRFAKRFAAARA